MQFQSPEILLGVQRVIKALVHDSIWREDLLQEALIHLWRSEPESEKHSPSWHVQRCRFVILDWLKRGRSLDAPRRRHNAVHLDRDPDDEDVLNHPSLQTVHVFQEVAARDMLEALRRRLRSSERVVLELLAEGMCDREIAEALGVDRSAISRRRNRIARLAATLGAFT